MTISKEIDHLTEQLEQAIMQGRPYHERRKLTDKIATMALQEEDQKEVQL